MAEKALSNDDRIVVNKYRQLLRYSTVTDPVQKKRIRKAYNFAVEAHKDMRRKSGEPYVIHPIEVAVIATREIGLGATSIICALLHDVVEDTDYTLKDIEVMFGKKVARIIDGLTKISGIFDQSSSLQAENFRKMLLTLSDDVRVILIKLADRLHNMRTLEAMPKEKQLKIASETVYLYAPLAHRLGLFAIKSELEDLALKYKEPEAYNVISTKLQISHEERKKFIQRFTQPLRKKLNAQPFDYKLISRTKSISSIWGKMQKKKVSFDEIYDLFAIRIILSSKFENEKSDCWQVYGIVTDSYIPKQDRFRDWLSVPKANGYEALHTTVMSNEGQWVEIQIRSERMDEIAEKGYAAHWKYKGQTNTEGGLDEWLNKIRELLQDPDQDALDFLDDFKLNLFAEEIFTFTPRGDMISLPAGSTVIDFAYTIHSEIGNTAIGAKINNKLVPVSQVLKSGDQIEILSSKKQHPKEEWMDTAITARAKSQIKAALKETKKQFIEPGKEKLAHYFFEMKIEMSPAVVKGFQRYTNMTSENDFYYRIAKGDIGLDELKDYMLQDEKSKSSWLKKLNPFQRKKSGTNDLNTVIHEQLHSKPETLLLSKKHAKGKIDYEIATCCNPIPGDDVIGFIQSSGSIDIHRTTCQQATKLMSTYGNSIVKTKWREKGDVEFLSGIKIFGYDQIGLIREITEVISSEHSLNIRSLNIESSEGLFEGIAMVYVQDTKQLERIISRLVKIKGIDNVHRIN
jgi:GTP pyrophosphokinase